VSLVDGYDLVIFDLDGVVYLGTDPVPGAPEAIRSLVAAGTPVVYATNNASRSAADVARLLGVLGLPATSEQVVTSAGAAADVLASQLPSAAPVLVVGAPALADEVRRVGLTPVDEAEARPVAVVQGYGAQVGWAQLAEACVAIRAGAQWVATNTDATLPSPRGPLPGNGSLVAALSTALGGRVPDTVVGKPHPQLFALATRRLGAKRPLVVGDRLDTDIAGAVNAGIASLLVLTGVARPVDLLRAPTGQRPTYVATDLSGLSQSDSAVRIPAWDGAASLGGWRATVDGVHIGLSGDGHPDDAIRVLAAAAEGCPQWTDMRPDGPAASRVLSALRL
jgi:HAD superfamily hydrolase (TIGR01450 family)